MATGFDHRTPAQAVSQAADAIALPPRAPGLEATFPLTKSGALELSTIRDAQPPLVVKPCVDWRTLASEAIQVAADDYRNRRKGW